MNGCDTSRRAPTVPPGRVRRAARRSGTASHPMRSRSGSADSTATVSLRALPIRQLFRCAPV
ncbi:hypothetical protein STXM2123_2325 [Streptomyces sp. F-3]|nr:hypothetical protein STXM2123_2325 [Streptomyces sp. F-3]